jgi:ABC-2 type transport system ATP-binding protein
MDAPAVAASGLTKTFAPGGGLRRLAVRSARRTPVAALDRVTFALAPGDVAAVVGRNGSGKSTLLRVLATLLLPDAGSATVAGCDLRADPVGVRRHATLVTADDRSFSLRLSGRENLDFFTALHGLRGPGARAAVDAALEQADLVRAGDDAVAPHSSGMRQRLAQARGLAVGASVLFHDEPSRALDDESSESLRRVLGWAAAEGMTLLVATHDLDELAGLWTRVLSLVGGWLVRDDFVAPRLREVTA